MVNFCDQRVLKNPGGPGHKESPWQRLLEQCASRGADDRNPAGPFNVKYAGLSYGPMGINTAIRKLVESS